MWLLLFSVQHTKLKILPSKQGVDEKTEFNYILLVSAGKKKYMLKVSKVSTRGKLKAQRTTKNDQP